MSTTLELKELYQKGKKRKVLAIISIFLALLIAIVVSLSLGAGSPRFSEAVQTILAKIFPTLGFDPGSEVCQTIILDLRLPRIVLAVIAGAGLAAAGSVMQGTLRNPLVSPFILGCSAAAGFGASISIVFGIGFVTAFSGYLTVVNAFIFSLLALLIVYTFARFRGMRIETVILAGVAVNYLFSALTALIQYIAPDAESVRSVVYWLMGGLNDALWSNILLMLPVVVACIVVMMWQSWNINTMSMGQDVAKSLGVNPRKVLTICMIVASLATSTIICFTGVIGFVCLVAPHITRMLIGSDHRFLIPCSALVGSCVLLISDTVGRLVIMPSELPVGIVTSLLGVPLFMYLLMKRRRASWG